MRQAPSRLPTSVTGKGVLMRRIARAGCCRNLSRLSLGLSLVLVLLAPEAAQAVVTIHLENLTLAPESYHNGSGESGSFESGGAVFENYHNSEWGSWVGWSYSNRTDAVTPGWNNQYSAWPGEGAGGSSNYGVAYLDVYPYDPVGSALRPPNDARIWLPDGLAPVSVQVANTTYAALSMLHGDQFAKKFGGAAGTDPDFFRLIIRALDQDDQPTSAVEFYLADFLSGNPAQGFVRSGWNEVDLRPLRGSAVRSLSFALESSDMGAWGMNTPAYFALDNLRLAGSDPSRRGDANLDGRVDRRDVIQLLANWGRADAATWTHGDFDHTLTVDLRDLYAVQSNLGATALPTAAAVPEPSAIWLAVLGTSLLALRRGRPKPR
jgi:hypothetical protein